MSLPVARQVAAGGVMLSTVTAGVFWLLAGLLHAVLGATISDWQLGVCVVGVIDAFMETNTLIFQESGGRGGGFRSQGQRLGESRGTW